MVVAKKLGLGTSAVQRIKAKTLRYTLPWRSMRASQAL